FWQRHGFSVHADPALTDKLASYETDARLMVRATEERRDAIIRPAGFDLARLRQIGWALWNPIGLERPPS
ncbi:hypothetical protein, partial [Serratia marcescens]